MFNKLLFTVFGLFLATVAVGVNAADISDAAAKLSKNIAELRTYQANFEQRVQNETGKEIDVSSGEFSIQRPNFFRWEIKQQFPQLIVADGSHLWTYDIELEQVTVQNQEKIMSNSPLLLLTSNAESLVQSFDISQIPIADQKTKQMFKLKPKQVDSVFDNIHILFDNGELVELLMADTLGQQTSVKFSKIKINTKLDLSLFSFAVPEGVDVVDSRERIETD